MVLDYSVVLCTQFGVIRPVHTDLITVCTNLCYVHNQAHNCVAGHTPYRAHTIDPIDPGAATSQPIIW